MAASPSTPRWQTRYTLRVLRLDCSSALSSLHQQSPAKWDVGVPQGSGVFRRTCDFRRVHSYRMGPPEIVLVDYARLCSFVQHVPLISGEWEWTTCTAGKGASNCPKPALADERTRRSGSRGSGCCTRVPGTMWQASTITSTTVTMLESRVPLRSDAYAFRQHERAACAQARLHRCARAPRLLTVDDSVRLLSPENTEWLCDDHVLD